MNMDKKTEKQEMVAYDFGKMQVFDFSDLNYQESSTGNCYGGGSCDMCDSCDHGW